MIGLESFMQPSIATMSAPDGDVDLVDGFTVLGATGDRAFFQRLIEDDPNGQVANAAQAYDCADRARPRHRCRRRRIVRLDERRRPRRHRRRHAVHHLRRLPDQAAMPARTSTTTAPPDGIAIDEHGDPTFGRFTTASLEGGEFADIDTTDVDIAEIRREQAAFAAAAFNTKLQQALTFLGFYTGPIDGLESPELTAALAAFQASVGLPPTGVYDAATDAALRAALGAYADLLNTSTMELQILLTDLGFYTGPIDGVWNAELTEAVQALQRSLGVPETGILDAATLRAAYEAGITTGSTTTTTAAPDTTAAPETTRRARDDRRTATTAAPTAAPDHGAADRSPDDDPAAAGGHRPVRHARRRTATSRVFARCSTSPASTTTSQSSDALHRVRADRTMRSHADRALVDRCSSR